VILGQRVHHLPEISVATLTTGTAPIQVAGPEGRTYRRASASIACLKSVRSLSRPT
jgi:hypothetical protein